MEVMVMTRVNVAQNLVESSIDYGLSTSRGAGFGYHNCIGRRPRKR